MPSWTWDTDEAYNCSYTATATSSGISYMVFMGGPSGGEGMAGSQSYEELLAGGPLNRMPANVQAEVRAHALAMVAGPDRVRLTWELSVSADSPLPSEEELAYVSAAIDDRTVVVKVLTDDTSTLFEGSLVAGEHTLALVAGFGRPWRRSGARTAAQTVRIVCPAGSATTVRCVIRGDFTFDVTTSAS